MGNNTIPTTETEAEKQRRRYNANRNKVGEIYTPTRRYAVEMCREDGSVCSSTSHKTEADAIAQAQADAAQFGPRGCSVEAYRRKDGKTVWPSSTC